MTWSPREEGAGSPHSVGRSVEQAFASIDQLRKLQSVTDAALANLTVDDLMDELLVRVRDALSADTAAILLLDPTKSVLIPRAAKGLEEELHGDIRIPLGRGFAGTIAATGEPLVIREVNESNVVNPVLRQKGVRSLLGVPLIVQGRTLGVLHVGTLRSRDFSEEDTMLLRLVGDRVSLAIHAGLYERERAVARTLQRSLLPERLPATAGLRLAARYFPGSGGDVGGDWYDVFTLPDGSTAVAIGDVVGRGLTAASTMGKARNALRAYALEHAPGDAVVRLNRMLLHLDPDQMVTLVYGVIDPVRSTFRFVNAGHLPPLVRGVDGTARLVELPSASPPLGVAISERYEEQEMPLPAGATLVLYTDGLIERRTESLDVGLERLRAAVSRELPTQGMSDRIVEELLEGEEPTDDVAILVARKVASEGRAEISLRAEAGQLVVLRRSLERWLAEQAIDGELAYAIVAASGEAAANAIEHAYGPADGTVEVTAERGPNAITVCVRDRGRWRPPRGSDRGRGIPIMEAMADRARVVRSDDGTSIELSWRRDGA